MSRPNSPIMDAEIGKSHSVLDHGFVRVVDYMGTDAAVVQAARVSYGEGTKSTLKDRGLLRYLMRHGHTSPFEMCTIKLHVKLPIFVARQWIRHRTASVNEVSARYSVLPPECYTPEPADLAHQATDNKQGRGARMTAHTAGVTRWEMHSAYRSAATVHELMTARDTSREIARIVQPVAQYTEWYWKTDLHNLFHFLALRLHPHAQLEIRRYAQVISDITRAWVPHSWEAWRDYRHEAERLSGPQAAVMRRIVADVREGGSSAVTRADTTLSRREWAQLVDMLGPLMVAPRG